MYNIICSTDVRIAILPFDIVIAVNAICPHFPGNRTSASVQVSARNYAYAYA